MATFKALWIILFIIKAKNCVWGVIQMSIGQVI